jgi:hypothetical protein
MGRWPRLDLKYAYAHFHSYSYTHCCTYSDTNSHSDADTKCHTKTYTEASPDSAASPYAAALTVRSTRGANRFRGGALPLSLHRSNLGVSAASVRNHRRHA